MPVNDLSAVTQALMRLFIEYVDERLEPGLTVNPTASSPEELGSGTLLNTLSVYLHHVEERSESRAHGWRAGGAQPVRLQPLGLGLRYVVTAHHVLSDEHDAIVEQKLLGYAAKTIHDHPWLDDTTTVDSAADPLFAQVGMAGAHNGLTLTLMRLAPDEVGPILETRGAQRPALFLDVGVVELEPEAPDAASGIVTNVGTFISPSAGPRLIRSHSQLTFTPPAASGTTEPVTLARSPAQVIAASNPPAAPVPAAPTTPDNHRTFLAGSGLGAPSPSGESRLLELVGMRRRFQLALDRPLADRPHANQFWHPEISATAVAFSIHRRVIDEATGLEVSLLPGIHQARVLIPSEVPGGSASITSATNAVSMTIAPEVAAITLLAPRRYQFDVDGDYLARPPSSTPASADLDIQLSVGGEIVPDLHAITIPPHPASPPAGQSAYDRQADHFVVWLRAGGPIDDLAADNPLPVRLVVEGAEGPPTWIEAP
jgi:Pvc16 N-terminal domain